VNKNVVATTQLLNQLTKYFGVVYREYRYSAQQLRSCIDTTSLVRYARFRISGGGDRMHTANLIANDNLARDNTYVKVCFLISCSYHAHA
jgi:hypothetical protein